MPLNLLGTNSSTQATEARLRASRFKVSYPVMSATAANVNTWQLELSELHTESLLLKQATKLLYSTHTHGRVCSLEDVTKGIHLKHNNLEMQYAMNLFGYLGPHGCDIRLHDCRDAVTEVGVRAITTLNAQKRLERLVVDMTALYWLGNKSPKKKKEDERSRGGWFERDARQTDYNSRSIYQTSQEKN